MSLQTIVITTLTLSVGLAVEALVAYDCNNEKTEIKTISLIDVGECQEPIEEAGMSTKIMTVLQYIPQQKELLKTCLVSTQRLRYHCGMHSHSALVAGSLGQVEIRQVSQEECTKLHLGGAISIDGHPIDMNGLNHRMVTIFAHGFSDNDGSCKGDTWIESGSLFKDQVEQINIKLSIKKISVLVETESLDVITPSGIRCQWGVDCLDDSGWILWPLSESPCKKEGLYDLIFTGPVFVSKNERQYIINTTDRFAYIEVRQKVEICGLDVYKTDETGIFLYEGKIPTFFPLSSNSEYVDLSTWIGSKLKAVIYKTLSSIDRDLRRLDFERCRVERLALTNRLQLASSNPAGFSFSMTGGPGYISLVKGEVVHLIKCVPVNVARRETSNCFQELPVLSGDTEMFMSRIDRSLTKVGSLIDCNDLTPSMFKLSDTWTSVGPVRPFFSKPTILAPGAPLILTGTSPLQLEKMGLFSKERLDNLQRSISSPLEQDHGLASVARVIYSPGTKLQTPLSGARLLDADEVLGIIATGWDKFWGWMTGFGTFSAGLIGILSIIKVFQWMIDSIINGTLLFQAYGLSWKLLAAIWANLSHLLLINHASKMKQDEPLVPKEETAPMYPRQFIETV